MRVNISSNKLQNVIMKQRSRTQVVKCFYITILLNLLSSCSPISVGPSLEDVLEANPQLKEVLDKYEGDSLKYKAALFLIENLPFHSTYDDKSMDAHLKLYELHATGKYWPEQVLDSITKTYGSLDRSRLRNSSDVFIDPAYLIENIEWAFKVWRQQPWGKNVSFENFCEYILPYRVGNERLSSWREKIYQHYNPMLNSIRNLKEAEDPLFVSKVLFDSLRNGPIHFTEAFSPAPHIGPKIVEWRSGSCADFVDLLTYVFRAVGLPCSEEIMLMRGNRNAPHYWNAVFDKNGNSYFCTLLDNMTEPKPLDTYWDPKGKVYRSTFSVNRSMVKAIGVESEKIYPTFRYPCMQDVTSLYAGKKSWTVKISSDKMYGSFSKNELVYLCSSCRMDWIPITWAHYETNSVQFNNVEGQMVFRLATYDDKCLHFRSDPFILDRETGVIQYLVSDKEVEEVKLLHKFPLYLDGFVGRMINGIFEGSNDASFRHCDTLFMIKDYPIRLNNVAYLKNSSKYRYVRYKGKNGSYCNVSEIAFYCSATDSLPLKGKIIGTSGGSTINGLHEYTNAFDGDPYTSFDYLQPDDGWTGLDLGHPSLIRKIVYTPRNRDNFIRAGDLYELFYSKGSGWISAGIQIPHADSLLYKVPKGALLYLRNHSRGKDERIFEYKDRLQIFW